MNLNIAGLRLKISGIYHHEVIEKLNKYLDSSIEDPDITISYSENEDLPFPTNPVFNPTNGWYSTWDNNKLEFYRISPHIGKTLIYASIDEKKMQSVIKLWNVEEIVNIKAHYSVYASLAECFAYLYIKTLGFVLHSSAIAYNGQGIVFSAKSGVGKTTHTNLWKKHYENVIIINDDNPAINLKNDVPLICGTPFAGTSGINENIIVPLKAVVFIEQSKHNYIEKIPPSKSIPKFLDEIKKPIFKDYINTCLNHLDKLFQTVPVYKLGCNISKDACELVKNTLNI